MVNDDKRLAELRAILDRIAPGYITDESKLDDVELALMGSWDLFAGHNQNKMAPWKLDRLDEVEWQPPILRFVVERHGGTVMGSTRAEMQGWLVNLDQMTATSNVTGHRQLAAMAPPVRKAEREKLAQEIVDLILAATNDERLKWRDESTVHVVLKNIPQISGKYKQTQQGRHRRFREDLIPILGKEGWQHIGSNVFRRNMQS